jgi:RNA polymerase sigma-70 factor (ECF subfamily)
MALNIPIEDFIERLKAGEEHAYEQLYDNYADLLYGIILRVVQNPSDAENLLQDCFVKIWLNIQHYDETKGRLATWMINIARNVAIDFTRSSYFKKRSMIQNAEKIVNLEDTRYDVQIFQDTQELSQVVQNLPPTCREIIEWMYFQGFSQSEISEKFGIPLGTVKSRTRQAMKNLRSMYNL